MARSKAPTDPELATERMRELLRELESELGSASRAAQRVGLSRSYVTRLLGGDRAAIGQGAIDTVCDSLGLDPSFFSDAESREHYKHYLTGLQIEAGTWLVGPPSRGQRNLFDSDSSDPFQAASALLLAESVRAARFGLLLEAIRRAHAQGDFARAKRLGGTLRHVVSELRRLMDTDAGKSATTSIEELLDDSREDIESTLGIKRR